MTRTGWISILALGVFVLAAVVRMSWPAKVTSLPCAPDELRLDARGIAHCGQPGTNVLSASQLLTMGGKLKLNRASEADLTVLEGIGPKLAKTLVDSRPDGGFAHWDEVNAVPGIGPAKLQMLQQKTELQ